MSVKNHRAAWTLGLAVVGATGCTIEQPGAQETKTLADDAPTASPDQQGVTAVPPTCTPEHLGAIRSGAPVTCSGTLYKGEVIKYPLRFRGSKASNVTLDCNGALVQSIHVYSNIEPFLNNGVPHTVNGYPVGLKNSQGYYVRDRPENVTVKNCRVDKDIRVWGLGKNGQDDYVWTSSRDTTLPGHVARARHAAPTNITFDNVTISAYGPNAYYLGPGVTYTTLKNSEIKGEANINVYLDAESAYNTIKNNKIHAATPSRELFAIDGSSYNTIIDNEFSALNNGGIYLYRNCGEEAAPRYSHPSYNQIINNTFYYANYTGETPSVWLGSRNGERFNDYCGKDTSLGIHGSSSTSNWDSARHNVVMQNQIYVRGVNEAIRTGEKPGSLIYDIAQADNSPNYVNYNSSVTTAASRKAGCYLGSGYSKDFISHGDKLEHRSGSSCVTISCNDNVRSEVACPTADRTAEGFLEVAVESGIVGWARDPDFDGSIPVHIYIDGTMAQGVQASDYRSDLGNRGFHWVPPTLTPGPHQVHVYAIGVDYKGALTNQNPLLAWAPMTIYAKDYVKPGNNGTVSCNTFCEGAEWGEVGGCVGALRSDTGSRQTCSAVPGLLSGGAQLTCECQRGFIKRGDDGTASCSTFCAGAQWGPVGRCVGAVREDTGQRVSCSTAPGHLGGPQLTCQCVP